MRPPVGIRILTGKSDTGTARSGSISPILNPSLHNGKRLHTARLGG